MKSVILSQWLGCFDVQDIEETEDLYQFTTHFDDIRLRGMDVVECVLASSKSDKTVLRRKIRDTGKVGRIPIILTSDEDVYHYIRTNFRHMTKLLLSTDDITDVLSANQPTKVIKELLRNRVPTMRLKPYDITRPALGSMFFGREYELDRLIYDTDVSFAIVGPGRIGKTSIAQNYVEYLRRSRDIRLQRTRLIDLYSQENKPSDDLAQYISMKIVNNSHSAEVTVNDLGRHLRYLSSQYFDNQPLDLILDEVDALAESDVIDALAELSKTTNTNQKRPVCRIILIGRGRLYRRMYDDDFALSKRLSILRIEPLDRKSARNLITLPLEDMGFHFKDRTDVDFVLELTGGLPHLIQIVCNNLVHELVKDSSQVVQSIHIKRILRDMDFMNMVLSPLNEISKTNYEAYQLAVSIIKRGLRYLSLEDVYTLSCELNLKLDRIQVREICMDMVVHNILIWTGKGYRIANQAMIHASHQTGVISDAIIR